MVGHELKNATGLIQNKQFMNANRYATVVTAFWEVQSARLIYNEGTKYGKEWDLLWLLPLLLKASRNVFIQSSNVSLIFFENRWGQTLSFPICTQNRLGNTQLALSLKWLILSLRRAMGKGGVWGQPESQHLQMPSWPSGRSSTQLCASSSDPPHHWGRG